MTRRAVKMTLPCVVVFAFSLAAAVGAAETSDDLPALARQAKAQFRALTDADIAQRKQEIVAALDRLEARLKADGGNGDAWRRFLKLEQLRDELARERPNATTVVQAYQRFTTGHDGLWLVWFADVRLALMRYLQATSSKAAPNLEESYKDVLERLANRLEIYAAKPTPEEAWQIGLTLRLLRDLNQAPALIETVHRRFSRPNLSIEMSRDLIARSVEGPVVNDVSPVRDCILGSTVVGTGVTNGAKTVELYPSEQHAVIDTVVQGITSTNTRAYKGPVVVYATGATHISATKRIWYTADGVNDHGVVASATTHTAFNAIAAPGRLIERIAWRKAYQQKSQAEYIGARHAEAQLRQRIENEGAQQVVNLREGFANKFRRPLLDHGMFPEGLRFSTTSQVMRIVALQAERYQLATATAAPDVTQADLSVKVHESMVNNTGDVLVSGMTVREDSLRAFFANTLQRTLEKPADEDGEVAIKFPADMAPIGIGFSDDLLTVLIRGERIYKNDELISRKLKTVDITARYKIERGPAGLKLVRQGEVEVLPTGFKAEEGKPLSAEVTLVRNALKGNLEKAFPPERTLDFDLVTDRGNMGRMTAVDAKAQGGWLALAWRLDPPVAAATVAAQ